MIEVIRKGSLKKIECYMCGALLKYNVNEDVIKSQEPDWKGGMYTKEYIKCPECGEEIVLSGIPR